MENLDLKTAIQIAKIIATAPEERMPMIWDIFNKADLDIGGLDEMAEWKALSKQSYLIDTEAFLESITQGREAINGEYRIKAEDFNQHCFNQKLNARCTRKHLATVGAIRVAHLSDGKKTYTCPCYNSDTDSTYRAVCIYENWQERIGK